MLRRLLLLTFLATSAATSTAQWQLQDAHTTADLRGIDNVGGGVAWASGTDGTILRTEDAGFVWQLCAKPPGGEHLDFRGIQAFDNNTAIVMSSGKGDLSRLYKTTDGCQTWKLVFTNPDQDGFWDSFALQDTNTAGMIIGDPVNRRFAIFHNDHIQSPDSQWERYEGRTRTVPSPHRGETLFAASNSALIGELEPVFVTGGESGGFFYGDLEGRDPLMRLFSRRWYDNASRVQLPLARSATGGAFSVAERMTNHGRDEWVFVVVGGDYAQPDQRTGTAAYGVAIVDAPGATAVPAKFRPSDAPPHGYRSAVAYDPKPKTWITVGPNGTDISTDDGRNWRALHPDPAFNDTPDADQHWNALSLPYAVGPHGRIGTLRASALPPAK